MKLFRALALSAALLSCSSWVFGQDYHNWQYQNRDERAYHDGYNQGRADAASGRRPHPNSDRRDFREGYDAGYNSVRRSGEYRGGYPSGGGYPNGGAYPNGGYGRGGMQVAQENGYRDGINDGRKDRGTGHSNRPTQGDNYKNAPGYSSSMGDRQQYKDTYRSGYERGYQEGYNGRR